jgi:hypothetical protein
MIVAAGAAPQRARVRSSPSLRPVHAFKKTHGFGLALLVLFAGGWLARAATVPLAPRTWTTTRPLVFPLPDAQHPIVSVKDPSVVYHNGKWHVFATTADTTGAWSMEYLNFRDWNEATTAQPYYLDRNPNLRGYHCAPQVFYFRPQAKWYLIYQSQHPTFSTTDDLENPASWTAPQSFFAGTPASVVEGWIDYWIICDETHAYLFFSDDHGRYYRSRTRLQDFPRGFEAPVVVMREPNAADLFEASCIYRLKGLNQYLCIIECMGPGGRRYFRGFTSDRLDGDWAPLPEGSSWATPFAGPTNVTAVDGGIPWSADISHGEMLRDGVDETMTVDPDNLTFLYQGMPRTASAPDYSQLPWRLALLHSKPLPPATGGRLVNISTRAYCGAGNQVTIAGFVVNGSGSKRLLLRALGPALTAQGIGATEVLADPVVEVHDAVHGNAVIATNDNWIGGPQASAIRELSAEVGATAFPATDRTSSALIVTLPAGIYTFLAKGQGDSTGIVLLEVYELDTTAPTTFVNIASRAYSGTGNGVAIGGFVVAGNVAKRVLLRAVGPTLTGQGVPAAEVLRNPTIELHDAQHGNAVVGTNDDWGTNDNAADIVTTGARVGATPLAVSDTTSAALLTTLQPGVYSFIARGADQTSGVVLVEVYDAD